jgi:outer membrane immunogenic protein
MKSFFLVLAALFAATPAVAAPNSNFTGPRIDVTAGLDDLNRFRDSTINYGANAGVDLPLGDRLTVGAEVNANNVFDRKDLGAAVRLGVAASDNLLLYGTAGYASLRPLRDVRSPNDFRTLEGLRVGGGAEIASGRGLYSKIEYRYSDFQRNAGRHEALVGLGLRF